MKVLLMSAEAEKLGQMKAYLEEKVSRLEIDTASDIKSKIKMLRQGIYRVLVLDCQFFNANHFETLERLKESYSQDLSIIVYGDGDRSEIKSVLNLGVDRYFQRRNDSVLQKQVLAEIILDETGLCGGLDGDCDETIGNISESLSKAAVSLEKIRDNVFRRNEKLKKCAKHAEKTIDDYKFDSEKKGEETGYDIDLIEDGKESKLCLTFESLPPEILSLYRFEKEKRG